MAKYFGDIGKAVKGACPMHPVPARSSRPLIIIGRTTTKMSPEYLAAIHPCVHAPLTHPLAPSSLHPQTSSPAD